MSWPLARGTNIIRGGSERNTFGTVRKNADGSPKSHQGWDFKAAVGTPCFAVGSGTVAFVGDRGDYGKQVCLKLNVQIDGMPLWFFYAHMSRIDVKAGDKVYDGQQIGLTGNSGNAFNLADSEDHLHAELRSEERPGLGLVGRMSPIKLFGLCPLSEAV